MTRYEETKKIYAKYGVDTEKALERLKNILVYIHQDSQYIVIIKKNYLRLVRKILLFINIKQEKNHIVNQVIISFTKKN